MLTALTYSLLVLVTCSFSKDVHVTKEDYYVKQKIVDSLYNDPYTLYATGELFFLSSPVCNPFKYELICNNTDFTYNASFLWTSYDVGSPVGQILLSSAYYGIVVSGFDWETSCRTDTASEIVLELELKSCEENLTTLVNTLESQLLTITANLKAYASVKSADKVVGSVVSSNKAHAIKWKEPEKKNKIFYTSYVILSMMVALLDFFIVMFSIGICSTIYKVIYTKIKAKKNPYYPLFTATIICSIIWNCGPGWLVLQFDTDHIRYSFVVLIPVQFLLALMMKKYADFPLPGLPYSLSKYTKLEEIPPKDKKTKKKGKNGEDEESGEEMYFFWEICHLKHKPTVIISFIMQTIAVWSLLVLFTYVVYYSVSITISLYLYPTQTLVKLIFIKAVAGCVIFDIAILFSGSTFNFKCTKAGFIKDINDVAIFFASLSLLPVIGFIAFVAGGVIFNSSNLSGLQGVLALLPSSVLLLVGWYSKGTLFPEKLITDETSGEQTISDVEAAATADEKSTNNGDKSYGSIHA